MSGLVNKVKEALHSDKHAETGTHSTHNNYNEPEGAHGPHGSRAANAADPRVDSDRDHRAAPHHHEAGVAGGHYQPTGHHQPGGHHQEGAYGAHNSRVANAADPRIDSDRDHRGAHHGYQGGAGEIPGGAGGVTGYNDPVGTHGAHNSRVANAADPRIDSDRDHRGAPGGAGTAHYGSGPGPAANTAGPHRSDVLNKADPRVDSDLDGSKTFGGNRTVQDHGATHRDPRDAAQVPPSVLRQHVGEPAIEHDDHAHGRSERHQSMSHQDAHRGI
ncbi:hypothetical protein M406DRAFT_358346 [Cryphonectria parasitica EP155]|uniref:Cell surface protein n=1 Tax=Cryphonectria parasitica (strain ATCC 38755 / EP155) TaxID=660469 RepID=A0A9P5CJ51_CRYP1|nr:uncharacterized protein M406DRAFT_358346 [Cryphonectria parasitica EP155]KAF3760803.1 hypothetical protein M406DRAFT_358346 [Cryphonectria parasitica EP155]